MWGLGLDFDDMLSSIYRWMLCENLCYVDCGISGVEAILAGVMWETWTLEGSHGPVFQPIIKKLAVIEIFYFLNELYGQEFPGQKAAARGPCRDEWYMDWIKLWTTGWPLSIGGQD